MSVDGPLGDAHAKVAAVLVGIVELSAGAGAGRDGEGGEVVRAGGVKRCAVVWTVEAAVPSAART